MMLFSSTFRILFGIGHTKLTYRFQGRDFRLTDVEGRVVNKLLAWGTVDGVRRRISWGSRDSCLV